MHYTKLVQGINAYMAYLKKTEKLQLQVRTGTVFPSPPYNKKDAKDKEIEDDYQQIQKASRSGNKRLIVSAIISFLRKWKCGRKVDLSSKNVQIELANAVTRVGRQLYKYPEHFMEIDFEDEKQNRQIKETYCVLGDIVKWTGAAKALHIIKPKLFMMWDNSIRDSYGCNSASKCSIFHAEAYFNFLWRSKRELTEVVESYRQENPHLARVTDLSVIKEIECRLYEGGWKSITKLLDEYNWAKYTKGWI